MRAIDAGILICPECHRLNRQEAGLDGQRCVRCGARVFARHLPGPGYASLGFLFEDGKDLPVGMSKRHCQGIDRTFLNCAVCHTGTIRDTPRGPQRIVPGMPLVTVRNRAKLALAMKPVALTKTSKDSLATSSRRTARASPTT